MKLKKILAGAVAAAAAVMCLTQPYSALDIGVDDSDIIWEDVGDGTVRVTGYVGSETEFVVPDEIEGKTVTQVRFFENFSCKSVTISASVTKVEVYQTPSSIEEIKVNEENVNYLAENGILYDKEKTILVFYPAAKTDISYKMPNSVKMFSTEGGIVNDYLKEIELSDNYSWLRNTFSSCKALETITVGENNEKLTAVDGVLFSKDMKNLCAYPRGKQETSFTVPDGLEVICSYAFAWNDKLTSVILPSSVTYLQIGCFVGCQSLTSMELPENLSKIDEGNLFSGCTSLREITISAENEYFTVDNNVLFNKDKSVLYTYPVGLENESYKIPEGVTDIVQSAFFRSNLKSVEIPGSVKKIGIEAFHQGHSISEIIIGKGVEEIGQRAFAESIITEIEFPEGVKTIGSGCLNYCKNLKSVTIPASVEFIGNTWNNTEEPLFSYCPSDLIVKGEVGSYIEGYCERFGYNFNGMLQPMVDEETNITVLASSDAVEEGTQLKVETIENEDPEDDSVRYNISLVDENGDETQPKEGRTVVVRIPVPEGKNPEACRIYRAEYDEEGNIIGYTSMKPRVVTVDGIVYLEFTTDHFSEYVVTENTLADDKFEDKENGVEISGVFPTGTEVTIEKSAAGNNEAIYNITVKDPAGNDVTLEEGSEATVKIKLPESWNTDKGTVAVKIGGTAVEAEIKDGYAVFKTGIFGKVTLSYTSNETGGNSGSGAGSGDSGFIPTVTTAAPTETIASETAETTAAPAETTSDTAANAPETTVEDISKETTTTTAAPAADTTGTANTDNTADPDKNINTGVIFAVIPAAAAALGVIVSRKRK